MNTYAKHRNVFFDLMKKKKKNFSSKPILGFDFLKSIWSI